MTIELSPHIARFEVKATEKRQFTGLASTWDLDYGGDLITPGAFSRTLAEMNGKGRSIPLINQHNYFDTRDAIGKMVSAKETKAGLEATFQIVGSPQGDEFLARVKEGIIDGLSIGYETRAFREPSDVERKQGVQRVLTDLELREVSLVIWGMNPNALIDKASVKSIPTALSQLKRETLTDDDKKTLRQIASRVGTLLSTAPRPADEAAAAEDEEAPSPEAHPGDTADARKAEVAMQSLEEYEALKARLLQFKTSHAA